MALLQFDENQLATMAQGSHSVPPAEEFSRSNAGALLQSFNTLASLYDRGQYEKMDIDTTKYEGLAFTRPNLEKKLTELGYSPDVVTDVMESNVTDWTSAERRAEYRKSIYERDRQVASNFSTAESIALGLPMAIFDIDSLTGMPLLKGIQLANKANLATKTARAMNIGTQAGLGGAFAAQSMLLHETVTDNFNDDSAINAALMGMAFTGTLGAFMQKGGDNPNLIRHLDEQGKLVQKQEAGVIQLTTAQEDLSRLNSVVDRVKQTLASQTEAQKALKASEKADVGRAKVDIGINKTILAEAKDYTAGIVKQTSDLLKAAKEKTKAVTSEFKTLGDNLYKMERATVEYKALREELDALIKERTPLRGKVTRLTNQVNKLQEEMASLEAKMADSKLPSEALVAIKKTHLEVKAKLKELRPQLKAATTAKNRLETKTAGMEAKAAEYDINTPKKYEEGLKQYGNLRKNLDFTNKQELKIQEKLDAARADHAEAVKTLKNAPKKRDAANAADSLETRKLREELKGYEADLSMDGLRKLLAEQKVIGEDIAKMVQGDFDVSKLYGIQRERQNAVAKLARELDELAKHTDLAKAADAVNIPKWMKPILISPIMKLLASDNAMVKGFATYLHSGTTHTGKIQARTAHIIKQMLDYELDRMNKAVLNSYRNAVREGFEGSIRDFTKLVSHEAHGVTGRMKRAMYTGIDGSIKGEERTQIALERAGKIQREHTHNNKWVNQAVDDYLNYYETIYNKGTDVGLEAFKNVLGKGYIKRVYSSDKIKSIGRDEAIKQLAQAQYAYAISTNSAADMAKFEANAQAAIDAVLAQDYKVKLVTKPLGMTMEGTESALKERAIKVFDDDIRDLLSDEMIETAHMYGLNTHGRIALKEKLGVDTDEQINALLGQLGATPEELNNLRVVIEAIKGTREISKNPFEPTTRVMKALSTFTSMLHTLAFGVPTMTEVASIAKEFGWSKTIGELVGNPKEIYKIYRYGTPSEKNSIKLLVSYADANFAYRANRLDMESSMFSTGKVMDVMENIVHAESVYGGLLPITDTLRMTTAALSVDFMAGLSVAKKISKTDRMRLQDMGFDIADLPRIRKVLKVADDGTIGNVDRASWGKLDEDITAAVMTMVERTILHPNGATLPKFMTNMNEGQVVPRLLMKFMRFPFESYERLLLRGMQESDAKQLMGLGGNVALWTAILAMKDAIRDPEKQMYSDRDGWNQLMIDSLLYNSYTSLPIALLDQASGWATGKNLTNEYPFKPFGAVQSTFENAQRGQVRLAVPFAGIKADVGQAFADGMNTLEGLQLLNN